MYILLAATIILIAGFYALYNTSEKAVLQKDIVSVWLQRNRSVSKIIGILSLLVAFVLLAFEQGIGSGILTGFILLMTVACLIIILSPLISHKH
jgi:hypothetical protein